MDLDKVRSEIESLVKDLSAPDSAAPGSDPETRPEPRAPGSHTYWNASARLPVPREPAAVEILSKVGVF